MRRRRPLLTVVAVGLLFMFLAGIAAGLAFLRVTNWGNSSAPSAVRHDFTNVEGLRIQPLLAIATLAGTEDLAAIDQMVAQQELDTAIATLAYAVGLPERQRLGLFLLVGDKYASLGRADLARLCFQAAGEMVVLDPSLPDVQRIEALAQAAGSLYRLEEREAAAVALDSARDFVLDSPFLSDAHRFILLGKLSRAAEKGDDSRRVQELNSDRSFFVAVPDSGTPPPADPPDPVPVVGTPPANAALESAQSRRIAAARKISTWTGNSSGVPVELIDALGNALWDEDGIHVQAYGDSRKALTLAQKIAVARGKVDWLTLKLRVARKGYGVTIVPEWEDAIGEIRAELAKAYEEYLLMQTEQIIALPQIGDVQLAESYLVRRQILAGRLGLYPGFPERSLVQRLHGVTERLLASQPGTSLRILATAKDGYFRYRLLSDESWSNGVRDAAP